MISLSKLKLLKFLYASRPRLIDFDHSMIYIHLIPQVLYCSKLQLYGSENVRNMELAWQPSPDTQLSFSMGQTDPTFSDAKIKDQYLCLSALNTWEIHGFNHRFIAYLWGSLDFIYLPSLFIWLINIVNIWDSVAWITDPSCIRYVISSKDIEFDVSKVQWIFDSLFPKCPAHQLKPWLQADNPYFLYYRFIGSALDSDIRTLTTRRIWTLGLAYWFAESK